jgi:hypothetical protein
MQQCLSGHWQNVFEPFARQGAGLLVTSSSRSLSSTETKSSCCPVTEFNAPSTLLSTEISLSERKKYLFSSIVVNGWAGNI